MLALVLRIFMRVIAQAQTLHAHCPGAAHSDKAALYIDAVGFIYCFGSSPALYKEIAHLPLPERAAAGMRAAGAHVSAH